MWLSHCRSINLSGNRWNTKENNKSKEIRWVCSSVNSVQCKDISQQRSKVHLIAAGPSGYLGRRLAGRTWDSQVEYQPCHCWWSVPLHSQTASCHQNAPIAHFHFSRLWSEYVHWEVCPWDPTPSESQNWTQVTWAAGMFLTSVASNSCLNVPGLGIPVCTSLLLPLGHEVPGGHLEKKTNKKKKKKKVCCCLLQYCMWLIRISPKMIVTFVFV